MENKKPKGMACAVQRAEQDVMVGKQIHECPYRQKGWRSVWISAYQRAKQLSLLDG